jgi:exonuclease III
LASAVGELRDLVRSYNPRVVYLCETKQKKKTMDRLQWSLGFRHGICVEGKGTGGGLALWWRDGVEVEVRPWCQYFIDAKITSEAGIWRFTGIYGEPRTELRGKTWEALHFLRAQDDLPWLCAGDFNEILCQNEQLGLNERSEGQMARFRDCLTDCRLTNLGFSSYPYTWDNRREGDANVQARLDRAVGDERFLQMFANSRVEHIITEESDHLALLIKVQAEAATGSQPRSRGFMFEEMWTRHDSYNDSVSRFWDNSSTQDSGLQGFWKRLKDVSGSFTEMEFYYFWFGSS